MAHQNFYRIFLTRQPRNALGCLLLRFTPLAPRSRGRLRGPPPPPSPPPPPPYARRPGLRRNLRLAQAPPSRYAHPFSPLLLCETEHSNPNCLLGAKLSIQTLTACPGLSRILHRAQAPPSRYAHPFSPLLLCETEHSNPNCLLGFLAS